MMRYKELLESVELRETRTFEVSSHQGDVRVWENPGSTALRALKQRFGELRGVTFPDGNVWVWRAFDATHQAVRQPNHLDTVAHFYIASANEPHDEGWTLGTWEYDNDGLTMWIDKNEVPPRLKAAFPGTANFHKWAA